MEDGKLIGGSVQYFRSKEGMVGVLSIYFCILLSVNSLVNNTFVYFVTCLKYPRVSDSSEKNI